ncbi:hypothetical protein JG688_00015949, partial [Phytophthora aleatoria]
QLLLRVKPHRPAPIYATQVIAAKFDHLVYFTSPYHPELQPIEMIWGLMKNHIAANPATSAKELDAKVDDEFSKVTEEHGLSTIVTCKNSKASTLQRWTTGALLVTTTKAMQMMKHIAAAATTMQMVKLQTIKL